MYSLVLATGLVYEYFASVDQFVLLPVGTVARVAIAAQYIDAGRRSLTFVVGSSLIPSLLRDSVFRMWHDVVFSILFIFYRISIYSVPTSVDLLHPSLSAPPLFSGA
jgi:hypothetical protein